MKIFLIVSLIVISCFKQDCDSEITNSPFSADKTALPKEMPGNLQINFNRNYGMLPAYEKISIKDGEISIEAKKFGQGKAGYEITSQKEKISKEDLLNLYRVFVENAFDTIKNDTRKDIVYDAPSEGIFISLNDQEYFQKGYGDNEPMSGDNLKRYQAVRKAIFDLAEKKTNKKARDLSRSNQEIFKYSDENFNFVIKDARPADLNEADLALLEKTLPKVIEDYNASQKADYRKTMNLSNYKRQIIPYLNSKGEKEIWINCFCNSDDRDWRKELIMVKDGGNCYFNLKINLVTGKAFDFMVNGNA